MEPVYRGGPNAKSRTERCLITWVRSFPGSSHGCGRHCASPVVPMWSPGPRSWPETVHTLSSKLCSDACNVLGTDFVCGAWGQFIFFVFFKSITHLDIHTNCEMITPIKLIYTYIASHTYGNKFIDNLHFLIIFLLFVYVCNI